MHRIPDTPAFNTSPPAIAMEAQPYRRSSDLRRQSVDVLSAEDLADRLGCEPAHINALAASHALPAIKIGRSWRFPVAAINTFLNLRAMENIKEPTAGVPTPSSQRRPQGRRTGPVDLNRTVKMA